MRVVATCTTLPDRYDGLYKTLLSLHDQTISLDAIYVTMPKIAKRLNKPYPPLPDYINKLCTVVSIKEDHGPVCKIIGALIREKDPNTLIITIDDDCIYSNDLVEKLINKHKLYPNAAITSTGVLVGCGVGTFGIHSTLKDVIPYNGVLGFQIPAEGRAVDIVQGFSGVLYKRCFFPYKLNKLLKYTKDINIFKSDDILLSGYLSLQNIKIYTFNHMPICEQHRTEDALSCDIRKMVKTFNNALNQCREYGMFHTFEQFDIGESPMIKVPLFILLILLFIIAFIFLIFFFAK
jgi:hypothetical protein